MAGAKCKYNPKWVEEAYELCRLQGYTDEQLSKKFKITKPTLYQYQRDNEDFRDAIRRGKDEFDTEIVENALLKRAMGMKVEELRSAQGGKEGGESTHTTKEIPPDPTACIFWLKNRSPERWRDKQEFTHEVNKVSIIDLTGEDANAD